MPTAPTLQQISFNQSHDLDPSVLDDGRIVFSRWDNAGREQRDQPVHRATRTARSSSCCTARRATPPAPTTATIQFLEPRQMAERPPAGARAAVPAADLRRRRCSRSTSANYVENTQPTLPNAGVLQRPGAVARHGQRRAHRSTGRRPAVATAPPSRCCDGTDRLLVSWTQCRLLEDERRSCPAPTSALADRHGRAGAAALRHLDVRPAPAAPSCRSWRRPRASIVTRHRGAAAARAAAGDPRPRRRASTSMRTSSPRASASSTSAASTTSTASTRRPAASPRSPTRAQPRPPSGRRASCASRRR